MFPVSDHQTSETRHHDWEGWTGTEGQARRAGRALRRHGRLHEVGHRGWRRALQRGSCLVPTFNCTMCSIFCPFQERNLLSVAYKNVVGARRSSWRVSFIPYFGFGLWNYSKLKFWLSGYLFHRAEDWRQREEAAAGEGVQREGEKSWKLKVASSVIGNWRLLGPWIRL